MSRPEYEPRTTKGARAMRRYRARLRGEDVPPTSWPRGPVPDPETVRLRRRADTLWRKHKMRLPEWDAMWLAQDGRCYLCGEAMTGDRAGQIDHDHSCCAPQKSCPSCRRGLACIRCNMVIGMVYESPDRLRVIADALEAAQARRENAPAAVHPAL